MRKAKTIPAIHPGEHLALELAEMGMSAAALARHLRVPTNRVTEILNGQRDVSADTAIRLGRFFGMNPRFWLNLQVLYDLRVAESKADKAIQAIPNRKDLALV